MCPRLLTASWQCYGHDIGGFEGPQPTPEHLVRWIQLGVHSPRFTINCYKTSPEDNLIGDVIEPWQYPSVAPVIRATIRRRYELVPYTYAHSLRSHQDATPSQRWTGWGYESDPTVWTPELLRGDTQYWFGDALLIAGVYEPGVSTARVYLPGQPTDPGFLNLNAPYEHRAAGQWHDISSTWHTSIPVLARVGAAVPVGKPVPTTCVAAADPEFPNLAKDDWRGVEIFPPPTVRDPNLPSAEDASATPTVFASEWLEDDGISPAEQADLCTFTVSYVAKGDAVEVTVAMAKHGAFEPLWVPNGITVILPVGEERPVVGTKGDVADAGRDDKGRRLWKLDLAA